LPVKIAPCVVIFQSHRELPLPYPGHAGESAPAQKRAGLWMASRSLGKAS
jgi:hypothetical protein